MGDVCCDSVITDPPYLNAQIECVGNEGLQRRSKSAPKQCKSGGGTSLMGYEPASAFLLQSVIEWFEARLCVGGGTTLLAALIEGRRAVGAEMDPGRYEIARKRLSKGYTPSLFAEATPNAKAEQLGLVDGGPNAGT
jgi:DNA modification methylase